MFNDKTKTFQLDYYSESDEHHYKGTFVTKKLTIGDYSQLGMRKAQLAGGYSFRADTGLGLDELTTMINEMIAHCEIALISKPDWFEPAKLTDLQVLRKVYEEVASYEAHFQNLALSGDKSTGSSEDSSKGEPEGSGGSDLPIADLVDKKIPKITTVG